MHVNTDNMHLVLSNTDDNPHLVHVAGDQAVLASQQVHGDLCGGAAHHLRLPFPRNINQWTVT